MKLFQYIFYPIAVSLSIWILISAHHGEQLRATAAAMQSPEQSAEMAWSELLEDLSFSLYGGAEDRRRAHQEVVAQASKWEMKSRRWALFLAITVSCQLLLIVWCHKNSPHKIAWHLNLISMIGFGIGIAAPMLVVAAQADMPILGNVIFRYESKSIVTTITTLASNDSLLLALLIGLFSVALPLAKMILLSAGLSGFSPDMRTRAQAILRAIGKWSMADVFVVAILVAYLAANTDEYSSASIGIGFYFFTAYCLMSLSAAHLFLSAKPSRREIHDE